MEINPANLPKKRYYRQRAHCNPHADHIINYPIKPSVMDWSSLFPDWSEDNEVKFVDIGCGYGGLLVTLSNLFPYTLTIGFEIRLKVSNYTMQRITALRANHSGQYKNVACIRTNAMKYLPNYFKKGQLTKMFFLYPDPHFKKSKHKWRIINRTLLAEYAYVLAEGATVYTITDVQDLHKWILQHFENHPLFRQVTQSELENDQLADVILESTEEGKKVTRKDGRKFVAIFKRIPDPIFT